MNVITKNPITFVLTFIVMLITLILRYDCYEMWALVWGLYILGMYPGYRLDKYPFILRPKRRPYLLYITTILIIYT
jgi:hypothetical protein